ncbi:MAG TPA: hypothetical protein VH575_07920 [Gemmataceae bacterium]|jgi:hypothetical protein
MVPRSLQRQLNRLRRRERLLRLTWAVARCLAVFAVVLAAVCLIDFVVDLYRDTPRWLRVGLLGTQMALWLAGCVFVLRRTARRLSDTQVSLWIEENMPRLGHRLISAVQLNRPDAATEGMSPEMIAAVTRQAEEQAAVADFARVADARRLKWAGQLLAPLALVALLLLALWPDTVRALLARQFLDDRSIPRSLSIESAHAHQVWPAGEEGMLRFRVHGAFAVNLRGEVRIDTKDGDSERHELLFEAREDAGTATFLARVPPSSRDFTYRAWLKDGRTHEPADVHFEPRPIVRRQQAWVQLPAYVGLKASGQPFEEPQKGADILYRLPGSAARVAIETQKPIVKATVEVLGPPHALAVVKTGAYAETVRRSVDLVVQDGGLTAEGTFSFQPGTRGDPLQTETAYRIVVRDEFGLENSDKPRRGIRTGPVEPPEVNLLPETLPRKDATDLTEEDEIEGIPILLGQRVPLKYECRAAYGLSHANLRYRVIPRTASREDEGDPNEDDFRPLPLGTRRGASGREFFTKPSEDPDTLGGIEGGGHYDFDSAGIPDGKGGLLKLQEGDRIQFYVEVFGRADPDGAAGRSAIREKEVVNEKDFWAWLERKEDHKERIRQLEERQHAVAGTMSLLPEERPHVAPRQPAAPEAPLGLQKDDKVLGRDWQLIGPFANDKDAGHAHVYPPETEMFDPGKEHDGLKGKVRWQLYHDIADKVDLQKFFDHGEAGAAYAVCWIKPAGRMRATLATGSDDGIKVWLNRNLVLDKAVHREAVPGDDKTPITLEDGWQELLVKVDNRFGTWAFYLDLLDSAGKPLREPRLQVRTTRHIGERAFIKDWLIIGPFADKSGGGHGKVFPPERAVVDLQGRYDGSKGRVRWKAYHGSKGRINLLEACALRPEDGRDAVAYAVCWVKSDKDRLAILTTGSDDGIKVWINNKIVLDKAVERTAEPNSEQTPVRVKTGWNEVSVKVDNRDRDWAFYLELLDPSTGNALPGVQYRTTPLEKKR